MRATVTATGGAGNVSTPTASLAAVLCIFLRRALANAAFLLKPMAPLFGFVVFTCSVTVAMQTTAH